LRDRRNGCLYLVRSPQAGRINSLFGDYLGVPLSDEDSACSSRGCCDVEQQGLVERWGNVTTQKL
jgi:hypothetical protein